MTLPAKPGVPLKVPAGNVASVAQKAEPVSQQIRIELGIVPIRTRETFMFNWFDLKRIKGGVQIKLAWAEPGNDIHTFILNDEGLAQLRGASENYLKLFTGPSQETLADFGKGDLQPPILTNLVRLSRTGNWAEIVFSLIPISDLGAAASNPTKVAKIEPIGIAMAHSEVAIHELFVLTLFGL